MSEKVSFFHGKEENVAQAIADGRINGSDFVVTSDTDNLIYVNKEQDKLVPHILGGPKTKENLTVNLGSGGALGGYSTNDTITAGTSLDDIIKKLLVKRVPATYTRPTVSVASPQNGKSYEVGTPISVSVIGTFNKNDAGALTKIQIIKNGATPAVYESAESPITYTEENGFTVPEGTTTYKAIAEYGQGAVKLDNLGEDSPTGRIEAGSKPSDKVVSFTGFRKAFYGAGLGDPIIATSDDIRALGHSTSGVIKKGSTFEIPVPKGQQHIVFAYPQTLGEVTEVMYVEQHDSNMKPAFTVSEVDVCGATAGKDAIKYNVYSYKMAAPSESSLMTFRVTI